MKVDFNFELKNLNDESIGNAGVVFAGLLMSETKGDAVKYFDWAMIINKLNPIEVDASDLAKIKTLVTDTEKLTVLAKAQLLKYLETVK